MALTLILTIFATLQLTFSQPETPFCLQTCLTEAQTTLCAPSAFSVLTPCLARLCPNLPATQNLLASLDVSISPKAEYSCQQSYGPGEDSETESSAVTLPLKGSCVNSPFGFKSFVAQGVSRIRAKNGCRVMVFSEEDCLGEAGVADVGGLSSGQCVFRGGRSARLTCLNELDAARAFIQSTCGTTGDDDGRGDDDAANTSADFPSAGLSSTTTYPSSAPYHGPGPTSSAAGSDTSSSIPFHWPFSSPDGTSSSTQTGDASYGMGSRRPSLPTTHTITLPSSSSNATAADPNATSSHGNITLSSTVQTTTQNATQTLTLSATLSAPATATALATRVGAQSGMALGLVGSIFALFL
ncbi:hypothetical protein Q7P37_011103 [Cladosporium fusiforme]